PNAGRQFGRVPAIEVSRTAPDQQSNPVKSTQSSTTMRVGVIGLVLCAVLVLMQCAFAQQFHFSHGVNGWKPGKRGLAEEGHAGHQIFRLKKGYHFFRLKKDQECAIGEEARALLADIVKSAQSGSLCPADRQVISAFVQNL
ncbi:hypothetical protein BOX15_Mlig008027g1, partial [Macrostomum lignano]